MRSPLLVDEQFIDPDAPIRLASLHVYQAAISFDHPLAEFREILLFLLRKRLLILQTRRQRRPLAVMGEGLLGKIHRWPSRTPSRHWRRQRFVPMLHAPEMARKPDDAAFAKGDDAAAIRSIETPSDQILDGSKR